jgi:clan AA aspartic protease
VYNQLNAKTPKPETIMGITFVKGTVTGKKSKKASVKFLVDSGAQYSLVPEKDWKAIGLKPKRTMTFSLADGTEVEREISECHISLPQGDGHTPVILGRPGDEALLGAVTLEELGLVLDPFNRALRPIRAKLPPLRPSSSLL